MTIRSIGIVGCGLMGSGIAQVCAGAGYRTTVVEANSTALQAGLDRIRRFVDSSVKKGTFSVEAGEKTLANLWGATQVTELGDSDLLIEAIVENLDEKRRVYAALEQSIKAETIIASNTSSLSIMELAASTARPDRFAGLHFFNPVPLMKLVEVTRALSTSDPTYETLMGFARTLGKEPISARDRPGFIVNRLLVPYLLDAIREYEGGLGTLEDIDTGMRLGCGHPIGPFALLDLIGLDTIYYVAEILYSELRDPRCAPPPLLKRMVMAGQLGRKAKRGFYTY